MTDMDRIAAEWPHEDFVRAMEHAERPRPIFNPEPDKYVGPVRYRIGRQRILAFESHHSYCLSSSVGSQDVILVAVAPDLYWVDENRGVPLTSLRGELYILDVRYERVDPVPYKELDWSYDPVYRIEQESFDRLPLWVRES